MSAKEEEITKEDLQAMKDMIKAIKMDPSLLYRLSSLPNNTVIAEAGGGKVFVDDDATNVSLLSFSNDWISGEHSQHHPPMPKGMSGVGSVLELGLPESVSVGICQYSKSGSPRSGMGFIPIWGPTYILQSGVVLFLPKPN